MARLLPYTCLLLCFACGAGDGVRAGEKLRPPSVLLVAVDGLRADRVGCYGHPQSATPTLDRLAERGVRYADAVTPTPWTAPALAALLTGRYPSGLGWTDLSKRLSHDAELISEALERRDYFTAAVVSHPFAAARFGLDQGFETYVEVGSSAAEVCEASLSLLDSAGQRPFAMLAHFADPLPPWDSREPLVERDYAGPVRDARTLGELMELVPHLTEADRVALEVLHDDAIAAVDRQLGRLLEALAARGRLEDTYVVVVGISGTELGEHGELGSAKRLYDEVVHVPWILAGPRLSPGVVRGAVSLIDVSPTLLALLRVGDAGPFDGAVALPDLPVPARLLVCETDRARSLRAITDERWKLIRDQETGSCELYDLLADPEERTDLSARHAARVEALEAALEGWRRGLAEGH